MIHTPLRPFPLDDVGLTIDEYLSALGPAYWSDLKKDVPIWPPDAFALAASVLHRSGSYRQAVEKWPPFVRHRRVSWEKWIHKIGMGWRDACVKRASKPPREIRTWWDIVKDNADERLVATCNNERLTEALLQICAAADEACAYVGMVRSISTTPDSEFEFLRYAEELIDRNQNAPIGVQSCANLCEGIHFSRVRVLPKARTTQCGLTFRSFTHRLSLCQPSEVHAKWHITPRSGINASRNFMNLLLIPWPFQIHPEHFSEIKTTPTPMHERFGMFKMTTGTDLKGLLRHVQETIDRAENLVGKMDGVILPEAAISKEEFDTLSTILRGRSAFLIAGVCGPATGSLSENYVACSFPVGPAPVAYSQHKHHRWCLERSQIINYGLASRLDPNRVWWEGIDIRNRQLHFFAMEHWLTACVLICEDLARQDPVAELVRSVGPNLVIALLADGPQLRTRWPHQYAAVLSDDPGSSVLSLTSLGMAQLSRPFNRQAPNRVVALWKDSRTGAVEVELEKDAGGVVLSLFRESVEEFTADNRSDDGMANGIVLGGIHPIFPRM